MGDKGGVRVGDLVEGLLEGDDGREEKGLMEAKAMESGSGLVWGRRARERVRWADGMGRGGCGWETGRGFLEL